ncbi:MAG: ABC transporter permease [Bifidobacterium crudilactis]|nr:ABC transporter permease [Bifidobacterium crudilactis]MCI1217215.1 ABC transporter permease [Bifidobacterium crudilactis]MDN5971679.1 ABC transporter permease [Bifidobacterium crudilactis]MDN6209526.1 ABC transporter permease [Bifidobacterium crudilactis]MDN6424476.1 ABC transporter permease [Bifidobacterium crudilactis]MDN6466977.1 ABC transporter permease [Bifidobacterium crudilactis]
MDIVKKISQRYHYSWVILKEMVRTDFKLRYQGSFLGIAWSVLKPLMLFCVMYMVFVRFLKFTDGTPTFPLVLLLGISLWNFFAEATNMGLTAITGRGDVLRKVNFPKYIIVASATIGSLIGLAINLGVVLVFCIFSRVQFTWRVLLLPLNLLQFYMLALGVALLLSTLNVYFRDIQHIWEVASQMLFYATPIIYPLSMVIARLGQRNGEIVSKIMLLNPPAQIIQDIRANLIAPETTPTVWTMFSNFGFQIIPIVLTVFLLILGIHVFNKHSQKFAEVL